MLDRPTVVVDLLGRGGWDGYADTAACLSAASAAELPAALACALEDEDVRLGLAAARAAYVADYFLVLDGGAAARVAATVAEACGRAAPAPVAGRA
jgi:hypothetical protein